MCLSTDAYNIIIIHTKENYHPLNFLFIDDVAAYEDDFQCVWVGK